MFDIQEELKKLPQKSGVYLMKDKSGNIIYVGKAINLRNRVRSYFRESNTDIKVRNMVGYIREFEYIVTDSEIEALVLENNLIKEYMPKYNIKLKDNKSYPYLKVTLNEKYPRIFMVRKVVKDRARYFGPYSSAQALRETIETIHLIWPIRVCDKVFPRDIGKERPCLNHHIGRCVAPCTGNVTEEEYKNIIDEVILFLNGKQDGIIKKMQDDMLKHSEEMEFEKAAEIRDKIAAIKKIKDRQKIDNFNLNDQDIISFARAHGEVLFYVFFVRGGKMTGSEHFMLSGVTDEPRETVMTEFVKQFYNETSFIPKEIIVETDIMDRDLITKYLSTLKGQNVSVIFPQKGEKHSLVQLAHKNAILTLDKFGEKIKREQQKTTDALKEIKAVLCLDFDIKRIEAYDISNTQGFESVGSMVVFENGKPKRSDYRKFRIKSVVGPDDYASMEEVITRRFSRYLKETADNADTGEGKFNILPDIIFMDGGRGQVTSAEKAMEALGIKVPVCGMVKDDRHRTRGLYYDDAEHEFERNSEGFRLITRIQDEVHRFAIEYHRKLRAQKMVKSVLDDIEGIGQVRRKGLMKTFGSIEAIRNAGIEELSAAEGMNKASAQAVYDFFHFSHSGESDGGMK